MNTELQRVRKAARKSTSARGEFEQAIRDAQQAGHSVRAIAEVAGLSHTRVHQIVRGR